ncbi:hypothetical protein [Cellulosimicrobium funkei]
MTKDRRSPGPNEQRRFRQALVREALVLGARIADGDDAGIVQRETTITETVLLNLHEDLGDRLQIEMLTQSDEGKRGADWIWCVGGPSGWFSFYVQAKKLKDDAYDIGYEDKNGRRQVDKLIDAARQAHVLPVHVLFNPSRARGHYSSRPCVTCFPRGADSFTVVPSVAARALLDVGSRRSHVSRLTMEAHAHPWACLAGCPYDPLYWSFSPDGGPQDSMLRRLLPTSVTHGTAAGQLARLFTRQTLDTLQEGSRFSASRQVDLALELAERAYSPERPLWAESPVDAIGPWLAVASENGDSLPAPVAVVVQRVAEREF